jgi:hypothetical protein
MLTLEHVPPASMGGKGIVLTCKRCNSSAGSTVDAALRRREDLIQLGRGLSGRGGEYDGNAQVEIGGVQTNARLKLAGKNLTIEVPKRRNNPKNFQEQQTRLPKRGAAQPAQIRLNTRIRFKWRDAQIGDLKSAYLAAFAVFGYRYALHPQLDSVREQINHPEQEIVQGAWWIAPPELTDDPMLLLVREPFYCLFVRMRLVLVVLPWPISPPDLYTRLRDHFAGGVATFTGTQYSWPTRLELLLDQYRSPRQSAPAVEG